METSRMVNRCLSQALRCGNGCSKSFHQGRSRFLRTHAPTISKFSCRNFSSSTIVPQEGTDNAAERPSRSSHRPEPMQHSSRQSQPQQDRPRRPPRDGGRIDLSTIPGMPSSYRPPARPDEATAQAKLRSLLGAQNNPSSTSQPGQDNNNTTSYPTSSLDAYTGTQKGRRPTPTFDLASLIEDLDKPRRGKSSHDAFSSFDADEPVEVLRLRPTLGRTVNVTPATGFDLTRAFRQLEIKCNANSVKRDEIKQRFHVRRGQRRKIERRARWRILFKEGFIAECARVRRMRAQGW